jgi:hypothetical protein
VTFGYGEFDRFVLSPNSAMRRIARDGSYYNALLSRAAELLQPPKLQCADANLVAEFLISDVLRVRWVRHGLLTVISFAIDRVVIKYEDCSSNYALIKRAIGPVIEERTPEEI